MKLNLVKMYYITSNYAGIIFSIMLKIIILALCQHFERIIEDFMTIRYDQYTLIEQSPDRDTLIEHSPTYSNKAVNPIFVHFSIKTILYLVSCKNNL